MAKRYRPDRVLFASLLILLVLGIVMVFSASAIYASELYDSPTMFLLRQLLWVGLGLAGLFALLQIDYRQLRQPGAIFTAVFLVTILLIAVLFFDPTRNTHRWLRWGSLSLQPSEFAKLVLVLFLAYFLERRRRAMNDLAGTLLPTALVTGMFFALV
ncbi:MAG: FtsW/RodA/SpoVE family cell cycle protein, partial [Candidatus Acidiferrales bacterium]